MGIVIGAVALTLLVVYLMKSASAQAEQQARQSKASANADLFEAVSNDEVARVAELLAAGADLTARNQYGGRLVHVAKSPSMLSLLVKHGADLEARTFDGRTPLLMAAENGDGRTMLMLIAAGADVNAAMPDDGFGARFHGYTPLHFCGVIGSGLDYAKALVAAGAEVNAGSATGRTALSCAVDNGRLDVADFLKSVGGVERVRSRV